MHVLFIQLNLVVSADILSVKLFEISIKTIEFNYIYVYNGTIGTKLNFRIYSKYFMYLNYIQKL